MASSRAVVVTALTLALTAPALPASAQRVTVADPAGDATEPGLDIVSATFRNRDRAVVARVAFTEAVRGDLIVSVDPRGATGLRLVSEHRPRRTTRNYIVPGSFTDLAPRPAIRCRGFRVVWNTEIEVARMRMPSRCLHYGNYGALRFAVLTERRNDTDYAPEMPPGEPDATGWVRRG